MSELPKRRGRPRAYDPDRALASATEVFWESGYAATSLDELGAAMQMNRPSLYGAFGDKEALYLETLRRYGESNRALMRRALSARRPLRESLGEVYGKAIEMYLRGESGPRGCLLTGTAATEAVRNLAVRDELAASLRGFDAEFEARFLAASVGGELPACADARALAWQASAFLHTLALRARAGEPRELLEAIAATAVVALCGDAGEGALRPAPSLPERASGPALSPSPERASSRRLKRGVP